jgi:hypothetical protein
MSVTVSLQIYSGRPNPSWELTRQQADELANRIARLSKTTPLKPPGMTGGLGYRGFSVLANREPHLGPLTYIHAGIVDLDRFSLNLVVDDPGLELWLLSTAGPVVSATAAKAVQTALAGHWRPSTSAATLFDGPPPFDAGKWNNDPSIQMNNNCYNYANDKILGHFSQPGRGSGTIYSAYVCSNVGDAAQRDGQVSVGSASSTPAQGQFIALVIWPGEDYHWYRLDDNAMWSHKPGQTPARNTDNSGQPISDPQSCNRGDYTDFCGFFLCIPANTVIN